VIVPTSGIRGIRKYMSSIPLLLGGNIKKRKRKRSKIKKKKRKKSKLLGKIYTKCRKVHA
jgi:hypothetical protein